MADVLFMVLLVVLFAATAGMVKVCDRLVGADEEVISRAALHDDQARRRAA